MNKSINKNSFTPPTQKLPLSHKFEDGSERPMNFVSRTLAPAKIYYSQLYKEGLRSDFWSTEVIPVFIWYKIHYIHGSQATP